MCECRYCFSLYSSQLKQHFGYSQEEIQGIGSANNLGEAPLLRAAAVASMRTLKATRHRGSSSTQDCCFSKHMGHRACIPEESRAKDTVTAVCFQVPQMTHQDMQWGHTCVTVDSRAGHLGLLEA